MTVGLSHAASVSCYRMTSETRSSVHISLQYALVGVPSSFAGTFPRVCFESAYSANRSIMISSLLFDKLCLSQNSNCLTESDSPRNVVLVRCDSPHP